jgi:spoIIIJ-associated protein
VEWVEASGKSLTEAKEIVLDLLGVAEDDAEFVVLSEPKAGLFGRLRGEARVQARVRPVAPPPKRGRRSRSDRKGDGSRNGSSRGRNRGEGGSRNERSNGSARSTKGKAGAANGSGRNRGGSRSQDGEGEAGRSPAEPSTVNGTGEESRGSGRRRGSRSAGGAQQSSRSGRNPVESEVSSMEDSLTLEQQGEAAREFVAGLVAEFGLDADVSFSTIDEDTVQIAATGSDLGLLVGQRGLTLAAVQDLTRTYVQRQSESRTDRILVDVAGYRQKRIAALRRFTEGLAEEVKTSSEERALEPMSPADRKVVHDTVNEIEGVETRSEGTEPARYVVIQPAG